MRNVSSPFLLTEYEQERLFMKGLKLSQKKKYYECRERDRTDLIMLAWKHKKNK